MLFSYKNKFVYRNVTEKTKQMADLNLVIALF